MNLVHLKYGNLISGVEISKNISNLNVPLFCNFCYSKVFMLPRYLCLLFVL